MAARTILEPLVEALESIDSRLYTPAEVDSGGLEAANVVDGLFAISRGLFAVADAIRELITNTKGAPHGST